MHIVVPIIIFGRVAGYSLATPVLIAISVICLGMGTFLKFTMKEMEELYAMAFISGAIIVNVVMWVTHYVVTEQTWLQEIFSRLLR